MDAITAVLAFFKTIFVFVFPVLLFPIVLWQLIQWKEKKKEKSALSSKLKSRRSRR